MQLYFSQCNLIFLPYKEKNFFKLSLKETACIFSFVLNSDFISHVMFLKRHFSSNPDQQSEMKYFYATCEIDLVIFPFCCSLVITVYMSLE